MMIAVIVPFSRPGWRANVLSNFDRQSYAAKRLFIVENGLGIGGSTGGDVVLRIAKPSKSAAINAGVGAAHAMGLQYFAVMDDDDLYGEGYLDEVARCRSRADVTGLCEFQFQAPDGSEWMLNPGKRELSVPCVHAATVAGPTSGLPSWFEGPWSTGNGSSAAPLWYQDLHRAGRSVYARRSSGFVHRRFSDPAHRHMTLQSWQNMVQSLAGIAIDPIRS